MNDNDFMSQFKEDPRKEFSNSLYEMINQREKNELKWIIREKPLAALAAIVVIVIVITFTTVPSVRAATMQLIRQIAGFSFQEAESPSEILIEEDGKKYSYSIEGIVDVEEIGEETEGLVFGNSGGRYSAPQISRSELEVNYKVSISNLVVPQGYETDGPSFYLIPNSKNTVDSDWLGMQTWLNPNTEDVLFLIMHPENENLITVIGPNSVEEVLVNGHPGALLRGGWSGDPDNAEAEWNSKGGHTLTWSINGVMYELSSPTLNANSLIQIAETMD